MHEKLTSILSEPFLLVQIGDYGHGYETELLPSGLVIRAEERVKQGERPYPQNPSLPYPNFHIPADVGGILMNKKDELDMNGIAYWAQSLSTRTGPGGCINSTKRELIEFASNTSQFWAILVTKKTKTDAPSGSIRGREFRRWTPNGSVMEPPTGQINTDIVYTESGKDTLVFESLTILPTRLEMNLNHYHVFFTGRGEDNRRTRFPQYDGKRLPYRSSGFGTCSLMAAGCPHDDTDIPRLSRQSELRDIVAVASLHSHICGRVV